MWGWVALVIGSRGRVLLDVVVTRAGDLGSFDGGVEMARTLLAQTVAIESIYLRRIDLIVFFSCIP